MCRNTINQDNRKYIHIKDVRKMVSSIARSMHATGSLIVCFFPLLLANANTYLALMAGCGH